MSITFRDLGLSERLLKAIDDIGYSSPTPIQGKAIPVALQGRDIMGCAQTGTGKTASFTLPMIEILSEGRARARMPRSLILTPTRELAAQVADNFDLYGKNSALSKALLIGGVDINAQMKLVESGVDVLICTPGRMLDVFERGGIMLTDIQVLVIDEADRMLDMGFIPDIERIAGLLPPLRQTLFFSATMALEIRQIAHKFLQNPKEITVAPPASPFEMVDQHLTLVRLRDKRKTLRILIKDHEVTNAFVFCNRKRDVDALADSLNRHGFNAGAIHGDLDQMSRTETLSKFKINDITILVASDVAARGIDIQGVSHVFNFDLPINAEDYIHRVGRTGRAGRTGCAYSIATHHDIKLITSIEQLIGKSISRYHIEGLSVNEADLEKDDCSQKPKRNRGRKNKVGTDDADSKKIQRDVKTGGRPSGTDRGYGRYDSGNNLNLPTEASQLPPFIVIGPNWMERIGMSGGKKRTTPPTHDNMQGSAGDDVAVESDSDLNRQMDQAKTTARNHRVVATE
jgi:superfamily II DNA/RNA helicase